MRYGSIHPADELAELKGVCRMEKTELQKKETYIESVHRWGRIWGLTLLALIVALFLAVPYLQKQSRSSFSRAKKRGQKEAIGQ